MESYSYYVSSSSFLEEKRHKPQNSFQASLHSIRKTPAKPSKKFISPLPPTPRRIYKVEFKDFKEVVQKLTGALPEFQPRRLQSIAPSPLNLSKTNNFSDIAQNIIDSPIKTPFLATYNELMSETMDTEPSKLSDSSAVSPLKLRQSPGNLSPAWCSFPPLSPGILSPARCSFSPPTPGTLSLAWWSIPPLSPGILSPAWYSFPPPSPETISSLG